MGAGSLRAPLHGCTRCSRSRAGQPSQEDAASEGMSRQAPEVGVGCGKSSRIETRWRLWSQAVLFACSDLVLFSYLPPASRFTASTTVPSPLSCPPQAALAARQSRSGRGRRQEPEKSPWHHAQSWAQPACVHHHLPDANPSLEGDHDSSPRSRWCCRVPPAPVSGMTFRLINLSH